MRRGNEIVAAGFLVFVAGSLLFAIVAVQIYSGRALTPLSKPLLFSAYSFLPGRSRRTSGRRVRG